MISAEKLQGLSVKEIEAEINKDAPPDVYFTVRSLPDGHTEIRSLKRPPKQK